MKPIFLIGYMGCGKTTLGRALSIATGVRFVDLDELIEENEGTSISVIFRERGEEAFRRIERDTLRGLCREENLIVGCGGGTPCFFDNMAAMAAGGTTVFLEASVGRLAERLKAARASRPLIAALTDDELERFIAGNLQERRPFYSLAAERFDADCLDTREEIDRSVALFINRFMQ